MIISVSTKMGKKWKTKSLLNTMCSFLSFEFQTLLNITGLVCVIVISYVLWSCLGELEKLRNFNGNFAASVAHLTQRTDWSDSDLQPDWSDDDLQSILKSGDKHRKYEFQRSKRDVSKRGSNIPDFVYDPFSQTDRVRFY